MAQSTNKNKKLFVLTSMADDGLDSANEIKLFRANNRLDVAKHMLLTKFKLNPWAMANGIIKKFNFDKDKLNETAKLLLISIDQSQIDGDSEAKVILDEIEEPEEIDEFEENEDNE